MPKGVCRLKNCMQATEREAYLMPFMMMVSSGTACKSFAMRDKRSNFTMRNIPQLVKAVKAGSTNRRWER